jgi:membrane associated rhomboid family serine protease
LVRRNPPELKPVAGTGLDHALKVVFLFLLLIIAGVGYRVTTPADRERLMERAGLISRELIVIAREKYADLGPFRATLRARTRYVLLAPGLVAVTVGLFVAMIFGAGALSAPATLVGWGANFGPRTTNGEWWRLLTSTFIHVSFVRMVIEIVVLAQLGVFLERLVGRASLAAVFVLSGVLAGLVNVSAYPMAVTGGTSGAIFGLYGLLLASIVRSMKLRRGEESADPQLLMDADDQQPLQEADHQALDETVPRPLIVPASALIWLVPAAVLFLGSALSNDFTFKANSAGLILGFAAGLALTGGITERLPAIRKVGITAAVAAAAVIAYAVPMRGIADVRPEISRIIALEDQTTGTYQAALERVNKGKMTADALAQLIDRKIVPELEIADNHLRSITGVPPEHRHLVANADEYLKLRAASWRLYAESWRNKVRASRRGQSEAPVVSDAGWHEVKAQFRADANTRGKAEGTEREALEVLQRLKRA